MSVISGVQLLVEFLELQSFFEVDPIKRRIRDDRARHSRNYEVTWFSEKGIRLLQDQGTSLWISGCWPDGVFVIFKFGDHQRGIRYDCFFDDLVDGPFRHVGHIVQTLCIEVRQTVSGPFVARRNVLTLLIV